MKSPEEGRAVWLGHDDMVAVGPAEGHIFVRGKDSFPVEIALLEALKAVIGAVGVGERPFHLPVLLHRPEIRVVDLLDLRVELLVRRLVVGVRQHHGECPARLQEVEALPESDFLRDPLDRRRGIDQVEGLFPEIVRDEVVVHDPEIRVSRKLLPHHFGEMLPQLYGEIVAAGLEDRKGRLPGPRSEFEHLFPRAGPRIGDQVPEELRAVVRPPSVKLFGDRVKYQSVIHVISPYPPSASAAPGASRAGYT